MIPVAEQDQSEGLEQRLRAAKGPSSLAATKRQAEAFCRVVIEWRAQASGDLFCS